MANIPIVGLRTNKIEHSKYFDFFFRTGNSFQGTATTAKTNIQNNLSQLSFKFHLLNVQATDLYKGARMVSETADYSTKSCMAVTFAMSQETADMT